MILNAKTLPKMADADINVAVVTHADLADLVDDIQRNPGRYPVVPISAARAATHAANPDADPADPALLLVMAEGCCRGYLGLMPQWIAGDAGPRKVFAFSTLLVDAPLRGSGVADRLLERARSFGPLLTIGNSNAAQGFFRKRGLVALPPYRVLYLPLGLGHSLARWRAGLRKHLAKRGLSRLVGPVDVMLGLLAPAAARLRRRKITAMLSRLSNDSRGSEACTTVPESAAAFIDTRVGVVWRPAMFNWWLDENARMAGAGSPGVQAARYHFHSHGHERRYLACLLSEQGQAQGVALFHLHHIHDQVTLSILSSFVPDASWLPCVVRHALSLALRHGVDVIRAGAEFEQVFEGLAEGGTLPVRTRQGYVDVVADPDAFKHYRESFADGDIALY